jgi:NhaP-type Na+/H+ or K+/H+ antiporter
MRSGFDIEIKTSYTAILFIAIIPQFLEATCAALIASAIFGMDMDIAYVLGYSLASTGPGIILPCLTKLIGEGYGLKSKLPYTIFVTCALDDISSIVG